MEHWRAFDIVKPEKEKATAIYNLLRKIVNTRQILELVALLGLISWSTAGVPAAAAHALRISAYLFNHRAAFLLGNAIIVVLLLHFRRSDAAAAGLYEEYYVKHSEAAEHRADPAPPAPQEAAHGGEEVVGMRPCDDVAAAIEKAARQIKRFQRTQSEKLRREIGARPQAVLRLSESENGRMAARGCGQGTADMERLSSDEFRRTVDAFIDKHWMKKKTKEDECGKYYQLLKVA